MSIPTFHNNLEKSKLKKKKNEKLYTKLILYDDVFDFKFHSTRSASGWIFVSH